MTEPHLRASLVINEAGLPVIGPNLKLHLLLEVEGTEPAALPPALSWHYRLLPRPGGRDGEGGSASRSSSRTSRAKAILESRSIASAGCGRTCPKRSSM